MLLHSTRLARMMSMCPRRMRVRLVLACGCLGLAWLTLSIHFRSRNALVRHLDNRYNSNYRTMDNDSKPIIEKNSIDELQSEVAPLIDNSNHDKRTKTKYEIGVINVTSKNDIYEYGGGRNRTSHRRYKKERNKLDYFRQVLSSRQKAMLLNLSSIVVDVINSLNAPYMMYGGTLLGSYRHHDIIPWDDDIDFVVNKLARDDLYQALSDLGPFYKTVAAGPRLKFFSEISSRTSKYPWGWPYIDIHFYRQNSTHIWDSSSEFSHYIYLKGDIFPTHERPLSHLKFQAPRDTLAYLRSTYKNPQCQTHNYSHRFEIFLRSPKKSIPCEVFRDILPFVHRDPAPGGVRETLKLGDRAMYSLVVKEPSSAINNPYSLDLVGN